VINNSSVTLPDDIFQPVWKIVSKKEKCDKEINVIISDDESIRKLNKQYLGIDKKTDVLSFNADFPASSFLGDIYIDVNVAEKQKGDKTLQQEMQILTLHGFLHLLGYDHLSAKDEKQMKIIEEKYIIEIWR